MPDGFKTCFALDCDVAVERPDLMCEPHWSLVPADLQSKVVLGFAAWRASGTLRPYVLATLHACLAVAEQENRPDQAAQIEILRAKIRHREHSR